MLKDVEWSEDGTYTQKSIYTPLKFFNDALKNSCVFDLELGYFNSAAISVLSQSFATFIANGGVLRMAINQMVSARDKEALIKGQNGNTGFFFDLTNIEELKETLNEYDKHFFNCLSYLIQEKRIVLRIIKPADTDGIAHTKKGQFCDGDMTISFTGSANFTLGGLFNNREEIVISLNTSLDPQVKKRIERQKYDFDNLMAGKSHDVEYLPTEKLEVAIRSAFGHQDIDELVDVEKKLKSYSKSIKGERVNFSEDEFYKYNTEPRFPYPSGPREYQKTAFDNWKRTQKGLFAMATGTGKTLTSLNCLLNIYKHSGYYKAIILVPTITLVDQWEQECKKFNFNTIIKVCSKNANWKSELDEIKMKEEFNLSGVEPSYVIIATYASFGREAIFKDLVGFKKSATKKILLIADECHNMGAGRILDRLEGIKFPRRIGLSATPERQFDDKGNAAIMKFFGCEDSFTFEYTMQDAIDKGFLCRYYYYPHIVRLTDDELNEYIKISEQLSKFFNFDNGKFPDSGDILMRLLLKRKRIVHKAKNKEEIFKQIIEDRYKKKGNLKYTLVYVPEGTKPYDESADYFDSQESVANDDETDRIINTYTQIVQEVSSTTTVKKFVSGIRERNSILKDFADGTLEVLTSMKCLDEGVDVPRSELAIFCASTGNPRQFIQRRGRILRTHKDKHFAIIHDLVVAPEVNYGTESFKLEQSLLRSELKRVKDFAVMSENADYAYSELEDILLYYQLPLF